ncbi:MAG: CHAT domain-containing protein [Elainella sp. Prado103]|nr:CHAT domain-containing protein [Elainella sp. Prado103]
MIQEFHLSVTPIGNSQYLVRTEYPVPRGVPLAEEQVTWDVDRWLEQARYLMCDPLQSVLQEETNRQALSGSSLSLVELGQELFTSLFHGTLRESWVIAQGVAQNLRQPLRLRLGLKGADLPRIPWELMYGTDVRVERLRQAGSITAAPRPLVTGSRISFSRYQSGIPLAEEPLPIALESGQPLRILMVVSAPTDQEQLKLSREVRQMQHELEAKTHADPDAAAIQLIVLQQPGREELTRSLEQGNFQVLHYAGHSDLSPEGGSLYLVNNRTGLSEILSGDDLAGLLVNNGIRLAVFNSCRGAYTAAPSGAGSHRNLAEASVSRGIPAVLAMAEQIPDNVALNLSTLFYRNLKLGSPIDISLNRARQGLISSYSSNQFYWALPVLYLHQEFDGYLITQSHRQEGAPDSHGLSSDYRAAPPRRESELLSPTGIPPLPAPSRSIGRSVKPSAARNGASLEPLETEMPTDLAEQQAIAEMVQQLTPALPPQSHPPGRSMAEKNGVAPAASRLPSSVDSVPTTAPSPLETLPLADLSHPPNHPPYLPLPEPPITQPPLLSPPPTVILPPTPQRRIRRFWLLPILGAAGGALLYGGLKLLPFQNFPYPDWLTTWVQTVPEPPEPAPTPIDPSQSDGELVALAEDLFEQEQVSDGIAAVTELLNRNAVEAAAKALTVVPESFSNDPRINFLRGRVAWQGMKANNGKHTVTMAQEFWQAALEADPDNLDYKAALGFSYYVNDPQASTDAADVEDRLQTALQIFADAKAALISTDPQTLPFEAGISLVLKKTADRNPTDREARLRNALQSYEIVMNRDPERYALPQLRQHWLWTEDALKDWEALDQLTQEQDPKNQDSHNHDKLPAPSPTPNRSSAPSSSAPSHSQPGSTNANQPIAANQAL